MAGIDKKLKTTVVIMWGFLFAGWLFTPMTGNAQQSDIDLLQHPEEVQNCSEEGENSTVLDKIIKAPFKGALWFYQILISPQFASECGYELSCSRFSRRALRKKGVFDGIFLTADRLTRCTPLAVEDANHYRINDRGKIRDEDLYLD